MDRSQFFDMQAYTWIARLGGFVFIIFQQTILLDCAYYWNKVVYSKILVCNVS